MIRSKPSPTTEFRTDLVRSTLPILSHEKNKVKRFHPRFSIVFIQTLSLPRKPSTTWTIAAYAILRRFLRASAPLSAPSVMPYQEVLSLLNYISVSIILPVYGVLLLPAFLTPDFTKVQPETKGALPAAKYPFQISETPQYLVLFLPPNFSGCQPFFQFDSQIQPISISRRFSALFPAFRTACFCPALARFL